MAVSILDTYMFLENKSFGGSEPSERLQFGFIADGIEGSPFAQWKFVEPNVTDNDPFGLTQFRPDGPADTAVPFFGTVLRDENLIDLIAANDINLQIQDFVGSDSAEISSPFDVAPSFLPVVENVQVSLEDDREVSWTNPVGASTLEDLGVDEIQVRAENVGVTFDNVFRKTTTDLTTERVSLPDSFPRTDAGEELLLRVELLDKSEDIISSFSDLSSRSTYQQSITAVTEGPQNEPGAAGRMFLNSDSAVTVGDSFEVLGRFGGQETVRFTGNAENVILDGNIERVELPGVMAETAFQVVEGQLTADIDDKSVMAFSGGLNQTVTVSLYNAEGTLEQTGATSFTFLGPGGPVEIGTERVTPLGDRLISVDTADDEETFDASTNDTKFNFADGAYGVTIQDFSAGDVLHFDDVAGATDASFNVLGDSDDADGEQAIEATDPSGGSTVTVTLVGLSSAQDSAISSQSSFESEFGSDALIF